VVPAANLLEVLAQGNDQTVVPLAWGKVAYDGHLWSRTKREEHLSDDEFALLVRDAVNTERRRLQSLQYRLNVSKADVSNPQMEPGGTSDSASTEQILEALSPDKFESIVARILEAMGAQNIWVTPRTGDQGVDVRGTIVQGCLEVPLAVQAKRWQDPVHAPTVREFRGSLAPGEIGMIFATTEFSAGAVEESRRAGSAPITLVNKARIIALLRRYAIDLGD